MSSRDEYMREALRLAERGWGRVHPNPMVGALVVADGIVVGRGYHAEYGAPHAEIVALREAEERARGATLYVTLEPCAHHGKTPPCTEAILAAGIRRVVHATTDPNHEAGGGAAHLCRDGIEVVGGVEAEAARVLNAAFFHAHERAESFLALKLALSLDARIGATSDSPTAVTGPGARAEVHRLRSGFDAVIVGGSTVRADDPRLTVRDSPAPRVPPIRVVLDTAARLPRESRLAGTAREVPVWLFCSQSVPPEATAGLEAAGVRVVRVAERNGGLDLTAVADVLWREGIRAALVEGGGRLAAALLAADMIERLHLFVAPIFLGTDAVPAFPLVAPQTEHGRWLLRAHRAFDGDILLTYDRSRGAAVER